MKKNNEKDHDLIAYYVAELKSLDQMVSSQQKVIQTLSSLVKSEKEKNGGLQEKNAILMTEVERLNEKVKVLTQG